MRTKFWVLVISCCVILLACTNVKQLTFEQTIISDDNRMTVWLISEKNELIIVNIPKGMESLWSYERGDTLDVQYLNQTKKQPQKLVIEGETYSYTNAGAITIEVKEEGEN